MEIDRSTLKQLLDAQAKGLRQAYLDELRSLDTCQALENLRGLWTSITTLPLRETSGLVEMQACFQKFAHGEKSNS